MGAGHLTAGRACAPQGGLTAECRSTRVWARMQCNGELVVACVCVCMVCLCARGFVCLLYECVCLVCLCACVFMCIVCVHVCVHVRLACLPLGPCWEHRGGSGSLAGWRASQVRRKASRRAVGSSEIRFGLKGMLGVGHEAGRAAHQAALQPLSCHPPERRKGRLATRPATQSVTTQASSGWPFREAQAYSQCAWTLTFGGGLQAPLQPGFLLG